MLQHLTIKNYILINSLDIDFSKGLTVITGETGAGKSILLGALELILGKRADTDVLLDKKIKCIIEGSFWIGDYNLGAFFGANDLDYEDILMLRREILPGGKSRAFINDTPVQLNLLKELGEKLVNIHSQHQVITLNNANFQLAVIDNYCGIGGKINEYRDLYDEFCLVEKKLAELNSLRQQNEKERDYMRFQFDELDKAELVDGEQGQLESEINLLSNAGEIKFRLSKAEFILSESETNVLGLINEVQQSLSQVSGMHPSIMEISERLGAGQIELKDIVSSIQQLNYQVQDDPGKLEILNQRLDTLYKLEKKHHVGSVEDLIRLKSDISIRLNEMDNFDTRIAVLEKSSVEMKERLTGMAREISGTRKNIFDGFGREILSRISESGIKDASFKVQHSILEQLNRDGMDHIRFLFSANRGQELRELSHVASGGELSRLMLAIKSMISENNLLPTIVFDEIDSGISGETAGKVSSILKNMSRQMQVIAITHLHQIAAAGDTHFLVYKESEGENTLSAIRKLSQGERINEIAKMLGGIKISESTLQAAKELMKN